MKFKNTMNILDMNSKESVNHITGKSDNMLAKLNRSGCFKTYNNFLKTNKKGTT